MVLQELFSGIGGFALGLKNAGFIFTEHQFSEIDKHAIANYHYNFKDAKHVGSVTAIQPGSITKPNIITFGSPCQDFSVSGKGKGLDGNRSSLISEAIRLIATQRPDIFIWENVKGTFSTNAGEDFWAIIKSFANIGGYELQWQLVNTKWILPQNRERIYLIGLRADSPYSKKKIFPLTKDDLTPYQRSVKQPHPKYSTTIGTKQGSRKYDTYLQTKTTTPNLKIYTKMPRSGDRKKGGTGVLTKYHTTYCIDTRNSQAITTHQGIRNLTEIEAERLQGFPDDWTKYGNYNGSIKEIAMTNRYKLIGNAVTSKMVEIISKKLL